jgi:ABC-type uncharacterized transport system permease subunit
VNLLWDLAFWTQVLAGGVRLGLPVGLAAIGENIGERAGVFNIGIEGAMALGAFTGYAATVETGSPAVGLLVGMAVGAAVGLGFAGATVWRRSNQIIMGFALALAGTGFAVYMFRSFYASGTPPLLPSIDDVQIPGFADIPLIGTPLFGQTPLIYILPVVAVASWFLLSRTRLGLQIRACGEDPAAAEGRGVRVRRVRTIALVLAGSLVGLGGSILSVGLVNGYQETIVSGRGFVAIALVIAGRWRPWLITLAALGFGTLQSFQLRIQGTDIDIPSQLLTALPFLATFLVMAFGAQSRAAPAALGRSQS